MSQVLILSSYVAASRVGGSIAPYVLAPLGVDPILIPTSLFGRHPGKGGPGGVPMQVSVMQKVLAGVEADGLFPLLDGILTGHFSSPEQVALAVETIDRVRADGAGTSRPWVVVDPIMGDEAPGAYVRPAVAAALTRALVPRADLVAPNLWEFAQILGASVDDVCSPEAVVERARARGGAWLVSSVRQGAEIGAVVVNGDGQAWFAHAPRQTASVPNGTGDLLTLAYVGRVLRGALPPVALAQAVGVTAVIIARARQAGASELPLVTSQDILADAPEIPVTEF